MSLKRFNGFPHFEVKMDIDSFSIGFSDSISSSCTTELSVEPNHNITLDYKCKCGGDFEYENTVLTSIPPQYPYRCNKCGKRVIKRADGTTYNAQ
jgi:DNA-directed RNA polymerase subunit RPC12/RpoP